MARGRKSTTGEVDKELLYQVSPAARIADMQPPVKIDGSLLDFAAYPFIPAIIDCPAPRITIIKGAQLGFTSAMVLRSIVRMYYKNLRGLLYLFPRDKDVTDFSRARFSRVLENKALKPLVRDTDSIGLKRIGEGYAYFRAASWDNTKEGIGSPGLKSIPVDELIEDERDEMNDDAVEQAQHRLDSSEIVSPAGNGVEINLSTPSIPGYGVDLAYESTNQQVWMIKCHACNDWTCLELRWPEAFGRKGQDYFRMCAKCGKEIHPADGDWVARRPDEKERFGFYVSQLCSVRRHPNVIMEEYAKQTAKGKIREFTRSVLGRAYADIDQSLTKPLLDALCEPQFPRQMNDDGPCGMGVDAGSKDFMWTVGKRVTSTLNRVIGFGVCRDEAELVRIARAFNVEKMVIDEMAEARAVRRIKEALRGIAYGCHYTDQRGDVLWDLQDRIVKTNRTASLDQSHYNLTHGVYALPAADQFYHEAFAPQVINLVRKVQEKSRGTGDETAIWVPKGTKNDHFRHALNYLDLALTKVGLATSSAARNPRGRARRYHGRKSYLAR